MRKTKSEKENLITGTLGTLKTRLAQNHDEIKQAQRVRYKVFCEEFSALKKINSSLKLEQEQHDLICDHLLVLETNNLQTPKTIGTQRFLVKTATDKHLSFRSQNEFDMDALALKHPEKRFMELGRSCILEAYRSKRTMELMWHGTWAYAVQKQVDVMIGCASFYTQNISEINMALGLLSKISDNNPAWQVRPTSKNSIGIKQFESLVKDKKQALRSMPPLIKGYMRLGAYFSNDIVIDKDFGTIDIAVILPVANINPRYVNYYGANATKHRDKT